MDDQMEPPNKRIQAKWSPSDLDTLIRLAELKSEQKVAKRKDPSVKVLSWQEIGNCVGGRSANSTEARYHALIRKKADVPIVNFASQPNRTQSTFGQSTKDTKVDSQIYQLESLDSQPNSSSQNSFRARRIGSPLGSPRATRSISASVNGFSGDGNADIGTLYSPHLARPSNSTSNAAQRAKSLPVTDTARQLEQEEEWDRTRAERRLELENEITTHQSQRESVDLVWQLEQEEEWDRARAERRLGLEKKITVLKIRKDNLTRLKELKRKRLLEEQFLTELERKRDELDRDICKMAVTLLDQNED